MTQGQVKRPGLPCRLSEAWILREILRGEVFGEVSRMRESTEGKGRAASGGALASEFMIQL